VKISIESQSLLPEFNALFLNTRGRFLEAKTKTLFGPV
jgi:hypothetical protein